MKDSKGHGSNARGGNGRFASQTSTGITNAARERVAMRAMADKRTIQTRPNTPASATPHQIPGSGPARMDVPHMRSIEVATAGKRLTLARTSALGATTFKTGGG
jgi:hypothetical protein